METLLQVREALKAEHISTDYKGWLQMLENHFIEYGEVPQTVKAKNFEWNQHGKTKTAYNAKILMNDNAQTIICEDGTIFEIEPSGFGWEGFKIVNSEAYSKYKTYMPYSVYIAG